MDSHKAVAEESQTPENRMLAALSKADWSSGLQLAKRSLEASLGLWAEVLSGLADLPSFLCMSEFRSNAIVRLPSCPQSWGQLDCSCLGFCVGWNL